MKSITQKVKYKQSVVKFSYKYGVKNTCIKFNEYERTIYRCRKKVLYGFRVALYLK